MARLLIIFVLLFCYSFVYAQDRQTRQVAPGYSLPSRSGQVHEETTTNLELETEQQAQMSGEETQGQSQDEQTLSEKVSFGYEEVDVDYAPTQQSSENEGKVKASWDTEEAEQ